MFTSISAFVTMMALKLINFQDGAIMALSSLVGIWLGIWLLHKTKVTHYKQILVVFYIVIFAITAYKLLTH